jgi:hypothetical protein
MLLYSLLSRVYGSVTDNNGFVLDYWIYWQLLLQSLLITINYKYSQSIFYRTLLFWLAGDSLHSRSRSTTLSNWTTLTLISSGHGPRTENTALLLLRACLLGFPRYLCPSSPLVRWMLLNNGLGANHIENTAPVLLVACLFESVYLATGLSGSIA